MRSIIIKNFADGIIKMENMFAALYVILGFASIAAAFKAIDWLIALKYMTKDSCTVCRNELVQKQSIEDVKITRIETKVDMLLKMRKNES